MKTAVPALRSRPRTMDHTLVIAKELVHFDRSGTALAITDLKPSREPLAELQRVCPGIQPSYVQAVPNAPIWIGIKAF